MIGLISQFAAAAGAIVIAGIFLVKAADSIAERTKMGGLLVGSIFLATATSLPEFFVDISAVRSGLPDLAVGDLIGSSLFNLLILAVADLLHRNSGKAFSRAASAHALAAAMSINVTALAGIAIILGPRFESLSVGEVGLGPLTIVLTYVLGLRMVYRDQRLVASETTGKGPTSPLSLSRTVGIYLTATLAILIAAPVLAHSAGQIAEITGLGNTFVGTTLVALCTSLPELVSTITAVRMGSFDLALGNIFGSNSFNMILLAPLDLFHPGSLLAAVSPTHILTCMATVLATSVAIMGQLYQVEKRKRLIEPDALAIILIVVLSLLLLYFTGSN